MRMIQRRKAHAVMARKGLRHVNREYLGNKSYFARHWREYAKMEVQK